MAPEPQQPSGNQPREGDRRSGDRRQVERRRPPPPWRRPWAFVAYGVAATLVLVLTISALGDEDEPEALRAEVTPADPPAPEVIPAVRRDSVAEPALTAADFERLIVEGPAAVGRRVRAELWCEAPDQVSVSGAQVEEALAPYIDPQRRTLPAAECKWGRRDDPRREDFMLVLPPELAAAFASAPEASDQYIRRRRVMADVEWLGRSPALALRTVGVLRAVSP